MVYGRFGKVRKSNLKGGTAHNRRRRTSQVTKVKYQRPTAHNQKRQIFRNALQIAALRKQANMAKVFTDYQFNGQLQLTPNQWSFVAITDFSGWTPCLRQNMVADREKNATLLRQVLNMRMSMTSPTGAILQAPQYWSLFVITPRAHSQGNPLTAFVLGDDYIVNNAAQQSLVRLNSGSWKVLASKYATLTVGPESGAPVVGLSGSNPYSTWRKTQISMNRRQLIKNPNGSWIDQSFDLLPPWQRVYIAVFVSTGNPASTPTLWYDSLSTMLTAN